MSQIVLGTPSELSGWIFFNIAAGHILLPILTATLLFAKSARPHFTVINACLAWIIAGVSGTLLFYVGEHTGPDPSQTICLVQASMMNGLPMLTSLVLFMLVFDLWKTVTWEEDPFRRTMKTVLYNLALLFVPYIMFGVFIAVTVVLGRAHTNDVSRQLQFFYCSLDWEPLTLAISILSILVSVATLVIEAHFMFWIKRNWQMICHSGFIDDLDFNLYIRIGIFTLYQTTSIVLSLVALEHNLGVFPSMFSASVGLVLFILLATHPVVISTWTFRPDPTKQALPWYRDTRGSIYGTRRGSLHSGATGTSATLTMKDLPEPKPYGYGSYEPRGVTIIGRPEEAFARSPNKQRTTISTWGF